MRSRKLLALIFSLLAIAPALAGYMTLLGAGVGSIQPVVSWVSTTDPTFPSSSLTYSGPSLSTMFDSTGKLTYAPNNLLTQSNTFSNAAWSPFNGGTGTAPVLTSGQTDPLGGTTAFRLQASRGASNTTGDYSFISGSFATLTGANYAGGLWIKSNTGSSQSVAVYVNTGAAVSSTASVTATTSWQFLSPSVLNATTSSGSLAIGTRGGTYGGQSSVDVLIYAAVASAVTYETSPRTADQVITTSAAYYGPRIDYDPNTLAVKGLLIEEARTNLALQSNAMVSGWSGQGVSSSTDGTLWLDGATAQKRTAQATTGVHSTYNSATITTTAGNAYSASWNVKAGTHSKVYICAGDGTRNAFATFDISGTSDITASQASGDSHTSISGSGKYLGNGWFRLTLNFTAAAASAAHFFEVGVVQNLTGNTTTGFGEISWTAAGTETFYIGQPQYEVGSFPTSFIPTAASSVTRAADVVQFTGAALTALQGSAWSAAVQFANVASYAGNPSILDTSSNLQTVFMNGNKAAFNPTIINTANSLSVLASHRVAASAARSGGRSIVSDGGTVANDATAMTSPPNTYLGSNVGTNNFLNGHIASFAIYNQRLPDATLQAKSVVGASYAANDNGVRFAFANDNLPIHWRIAL